MRFRPCGGTGPETAGSKTAIFARANNPSETGPSLTGKVEQVSYSGRASLFSCGAATFSTACAVAVAAKLLRLWNSRPLADCGRRPLAHSARGYGTGPRNSRPAVCGQAALFLASINTPRRHVGHVQFLASIPFNCLTLMSRPYYNYTVPFEAPRRSPSGLDRTEDVKEDERMKPGEQPDCHRTWGTHAWLGTAARGQRDAAGLCDSCEARRRAEARLWVAMPPRSC